MEQLIEQIVTRIPTLTAEQVVAMNAAILPTDAIIEANDAVGVETLTVMAQLGTHVDPGVYSVARTAILGLMAKGKVPDGVSAILVRAWTDIVGPLDESGVESPDESPEAPAESTEEVTEAPEIVEPAAEIVDIPLDTIPSIPGEIPAQTAEIVDTPEDKP